MLYQLSLENLKHLDLGKADVAFQRELARVAGDCHDRPNDARPRTVTLQVNVVPVCDDAGNCDTASIQVLVTSKLPTYRTKVHTMGLRAKAGQLVFNEDSDDYTKPTLFEDQ